MSASLYVVIYVYGLIGGTIGPLPYDEQECFKRVAKLEQTAIEKSQDRTIDHIKFRCEFHTSRPKNQY